MNNKKCIHVWVSDESYAKLTEYAQDDHRSIANAAAFILEKAFKDGAA